MYFNYRNFIILIMGNSFAFFILVKHRNGSYMFVNPIFQYVYSNELKQLATSDII